MPYTHFRFIAYEVPTATIKTKEEGVRSGFSPGEECAVVHRIPVDPNTPPDARIRLRRLAAVVDRAVTWVSSLRNSPDTLKIFMAPEFYFRPPADGAEFKNATYPEQHFFKIIGQLDAMFQHPDLNDWLIVPGTVLWNVNDARTGRIYNNTTMHVMGNQAQSLTTIEKKGPSSIDGVPWKGNRWPYANVGGDKYETFLDKTYELKSERKKHIFDIDTVPCGLEVCLDHADHDARRVVKAVLADWLKNEATNVQKQVSLHLLTAGGMPIRARSVAARENGYILRTDGLSGPPYSELRKVHAYNKVDPLSQQPINPTVSWDYFGTAQFADEAFPGFDSILDGPMRVPMLGNGYAEFPQRLVFYPCLPLP